MSLYKETDKIQLVENVEQIIKDAETMSTKKIRPTIDELWEIIFTVRDFVKEKKRKIYGGFALNKLIEEVSPEDKFYSDDDVKSWDIDFYSPTPIDDAKELSDRLFKKGFNYVRAGEALHDETYKIFAETSDCADITYVPRNIYNKIPYKEINGLVLTGPHFMMIDYFRVLSDPLTSYFRLEKVFVRLCLMAKYFPLPKNSTKIEIVPPDRDLDIAFHTVHDFLKDRESMICIGMYAYNHYVKESGINEKLLNRGNRGKPGNLNNNRSNRQSPSINFVDINYYEIISTHYKRDARELILALKAKFPMSNDRITYRENYPFFQYLGYSVDIYFDDEMICQIYNYNSRCTPYIDVPALYFKKGGYDEDKGTIRIGSFATQMMYNLINVMKARANNDQNKKNLYYTIISHSIDMKNYYFDKTKKTIFDKNLFQEFILTCTGETNSAQMERQIRMDKKIKAGKKFTWSYNPANVKDQNNDSKYVFRNSSGNSINNDKNKRIDLNSTDDNESDDISQVHDPDAVIIEEEDSKDNE